MASLVDLIAKLQAGQLTASTEIDYFVRLITDQGKRLSTTDHKLAAVTTQLKDITALQTRLIGAETSRVELQRRVSALEGECEDCKTRFAAVEAERDDLLTRLAVAEGDRDTAVRERQALLPRFSSLEGECQAATNRVTALEGELLTAQTDLAEAECRLEAADSRISVLKDERDLSQSKLATATGKLATADAEQNSLVEQRDNLSGRTEGLQARLADQERTLNALQGELLRRQQEVSSLTEQRDSARFERDELTVHVGELEEERNSAKARLPTLQRIIDEVRNQRNAAQQEVDEKEEAVRSLNMRIATLGQSVQQLQEQLQSARDTPPSLSEEMKNQLAEANRQVNLQATAKQSALQRAEDAEKASTATLARLSAMERTISNLNDELLMVNTSATSVQDALTQMQRRAQRAEAQLLQQPTQPLPVDAQLASLQKTNDELRRKLGLAETETLRLGSEGQAADNRAKQALLDLDNLRKASNPLTQSLLNEQAKSAQLGSQAVADRSKFVELRQALSDEQQAHQLTRQAAVDLWSQSIADQRVAQQAEYERLQQNLKAKEQELSLYESELVAWEARLQERDDAYREHEQSTAEAALPTPQATSMLPPVPPYQPLRIGAPTLHPAASGAEGVTRPNVSPISPKPDATHLQVPIAHPGVLPLQQPLDGPPSAGSLPMQQPLSGFSSFDPVAQVLLKSLAEQSAQSVAQTQALQHMIATQGASQPSRAPHMAAFGALPKFESHSTSRDALDIYEFFDQLESYGKLARWNDAMFADVVPRQLDTMERATLEQMSVADRADYPKVKKFLIAKFSTPAKQQELRNKFYQRTQRPGESWSDFLFDLKKLARPAFPGGDADPAVEVAIRDARVLERFLSGLQEKESAYLHGGDIDPSRDLKTTIARMEKYDAINRGIKQTTPILVGHVRDIPPATGDLVAVIRDTVGPMIGQLEKSMDNSVAKKFEFQESRLAQRLQSPTVSSQQLVYPASEYRGANNRNRGGRGTWRGRGAFNMGPGSQCFTCHELGHFSRDCPMKRQQDQQRWGSQAVASLNEGRAATFEAVMAVTTLAESGFHEHPSSHQRIRK